MAESILRDVFYLCSEKNLGGQECNVTLSRLSLSAIPTSGQKETVIKIDDAIGCLCMSGKGSSNNESVNSKSAFITLYTYPMAQTLTNNDYRKRETVLLRYERFGTFQENLNLISRWRKAIVLLIRGHSVQAENLDELAIPVPKLLVFVNPKSGMGSGVKTFQTRVRSFLGEADIDYELITTEYSGHCRKVIEELPNLSDYQGIITVSGDGLVYEMFNGLLARPDWKDTENIPYGVIPLGSGNGMARSLAHYNQEPYTYDPLVISVLNVVKLRTIQLNICIVNTAHHKKLVSFLSVGWGLFADIDIESERLRSIGEARFTVWSLVRSFFLRSYKATISYLPADADDCPLPELDEPLTGDGWVTQTGRFVSVYTSLIPYLGTEMFFAPNCVPNKDVIWLMIVKAPITTIQCTKLLLGLSDGSHVNYPWVQFVAVKAFRLVPDTTCKEHKSYLTIDGERLDSQACQAQITSRKSTVFMR